MATENRAKFIIDLVGNVSQRARNFGSSIRQLGADGSMSMRLLSRSVSGANGILDKFDNKLVGFATGGGLVMAGKRVGEQSQLLTELGTRYNLTEDQVNSFNQAVWQTAGNRKTTYTDLITATEKFLERTNDVDGSIQQMDNIALAMKGIGLNAQDAGDLVSAFYTSGTKDVKAMTQALDGLSSVSLIGTGNLSDQVQSVPGIIKNTSWKKPEDIAQIVGMQRLANSQFNDPSQAASATSDFFDSIKNKDNQKILRRNGVEVYKDRKQGIYKPPADLALEIGKAAKQKEHNFKDIFNGNALQMMMGLADKDKQQQLNGLMNPTNVKDGFTDEKASKNIQTLNSAITSLTNAGEKFAQLKLAKPVQDLADAINGLSPEELDKYTGILEKATYAIGAAVAARYAYRAGKWGKDLLMGPGKKGAGGGELGGDGSVVPVYVTNWEDGNSNKDSETSSGDKSNKGGLVGSAIKTAQEIMSFMPSDEESKQRVEQLNDELYPDGRKAKHTWLPAPIDIWLQDRDKQLEEKGPTPSPYSQGRTLGEQWNQSQAAAPTDPRDFRQTITPPEGQITVELLSKDSGLQVKTTEVKSKGVDLRVNTGYTYGGGM
ncbi:MULTISPECIES: hypothetical protein [Yersinia]|uniref:hypothetical protein n=1 Tax=Yersinia TaxID=629 RepID=UPI000C14C3CB|nr:MULTISPECIES: hypothetical protein [Yersinia]EKN3738788.1 hypothetical protein [Yersinia enterocolitica]MDA5523312.1 hypothetical protein [Yersinia kristensenii]MDA5544586.1 hypothetical protein [Yersinia rochesterensis]PHZ36590.1 hypothetical protein CS536_07765 [Yersinia kristensenii]UZM75995.1 hypothetical protein OP863_04900 [Yersinia sp. SCPM-O-B-9106 (C-191)]